jgi:hypothetical protein
LLASGFVLWLVAITAPMKYLAVFVAVYTAGSLLMLAGVSTYGLSYHYYFRRRKS